LKKLPSSVQPRGPSLLRRWMYNQSSPSLHGYASQAGENMITRKGEITAVIADDHPIVRDGLRRMLQAEDMKVAGEAANGDEAVKLVHQHKPDILLLDLAMPTHSGMDALRDLSKSGNSVRIIVVTAAIEKKGIVEALQLGARGLVLKDTATQLIMRAIETVLNGEYWVGRERVSNMIQYLNNLMEIDAREQKRYGLTPRELQIVSAVVASLSNREIADHFALAEDTVKHHLSNIFDKLGVSTRLELALFAVNHSLPLEDIFLRPQPSVGTPKLSKKS
jgi:two-component system, NarL family, nitrate/nitrite response regulator NarL